ncbi:hypothetical protein PMZ80_005180 [Knufia obscura]|uniref:Uncharacterized protein n=1 Tax=Knufia obscura TaxID=1635080 RepID=A0ABR0RPT2_9EURO|nr:hypothetical protein PMZ80_005180 [Knufia obscura]
MPLFKKSKKKMVEDGEEKLEAEQKEVNTMSRFPDEKIATDNNTKIQDEKMAVDSNDIVASPTSEEGTLLPAYREQASPSVDHQSSSRSTMPSSTGSSSGVGPDVHPVTSQTMMAYDGIEVVTPERNAHTPSVPTSLQATRSYREYNFYYTNALTHLVICDPDQQVLYFAEVSPFAKGVPDVQIRNIAGGGFDNLAQMGPALGMKEAKDAPVVAVADTMPSSKHIKLGFGDPLQPETNTWIVMRNVHDDPKNNSERYDLTISKPGKQTTYQWISGAGGEKDAADSPDLGQTRRNSNSKGIFRLLSDDGLVAAFRNSGLASVKKRGALRVYDVPGIDDSLLLIFLSCSALCEKQRRRKAKKGLIIGASLGMAGWGR